VYLVSGLRSDDDVLRGEETEALGLLSLLRRDEAADAAAETETLLILPGTHSKHLTARAGEITAFRTFMTGELYNLLCCHSILRHSVEEIETLEGIEDPFLEGVRSAAARGMPAGLFRARTRQVLDKQPTRANGAYLSGLLLAAELTSLYTSPDRILVGARALMATMYRAAAKELGIETLSTVSAAQLELSVPAGQALMQQSAR
jgi:2-dehydro-3-deoxygalactonokinase